MIGVRSPVQLCSLACLALCKPPTTLRQVKALILCDDANNGHFAKKTSKSNTKPSSDKKATTKLEKETQTPKGVPATTKQTTKTTTKTTTTTAIPSTKVEEVKTKAETKGT
ncbi:hypothetical protein Y032_0241g3377 [Ancylostoma ceylanicum]|uniref:Uncharacterized protein n=1 Tax=Ancylostoma ceylanicum TaxID=53326 RepID=A0A016SEK2_9BILA|nr:hypothetical protein Y032_0241g3377 [Ancylostoma ceylanicum]